MLCLRCRCAQTSSPQRLQGYQQAKCWQHSELAFSILPGEVLFLAGLCSLHNANCPVPDTSHRVYVAVKLSPRLSQERQAGCHSGQPLRSGTLLVVQASQPSLWLWLQLTVQAAQTCRRLGLCWMAQAIFSIGALNAKSLAPSSLHSGCQEEDSHRGAAVLQSPGDAGFQQC